MRSRVAQRGEVGGRACRWLPARLGSVPVTVVVLLVALVATQPAAAQESPHDNSPDSAIQFNLGDPASGTWSGGHLPSMSPISPTRLTSYHRRLLASTATVPPVATSHEPRPDWIIVMSITGTTATPNVGLAGGTGGSHKIYLRYKEVANTNWNLTVFQADTRQSYTTVPIVMTGLTPNTNYMIQVSFDNSVWSPSKEKTFTTKSASATLPMVSSVWGDRITACSVRIRIEFPNLGRDSLLVYFRWKQDVTGATWSTIGNYPSAGRSANSQISLSPSTAYVAEATMDHNFTSNIVRSAPFTTTPLPDLDRMAVDPIADTTATVRLGVDYYCIFLDGYLRYKVNESEDEWTTIPGSRTFNLTGLTPLTEYVVEASLDKNFDSGVLSKTFTTKAGDPTVDRIEIPDKDITQTGAKVIVHVDSPNGDKVHIRYSTNPNFQTGSTIRTDSKSVAASSAEFTLDNLTSGTTYYVEASYDSTYPLDKTETANFTTDPPTVTSVAASDVEQTTATITVTVDEPNVADIHIRYSTDRNFGQGSTIDPDSRTVDTGATSVDFPLNGLTSGTTYYAQASYDNSPYPASDTTNTADFRTKDPTVSAVSVTDITQTGATVTVTVDEPNDTPVRLHYKPGTGSWSTTDLNSAVFDPNADIYTFDLTGLASGTVYTVYASYGSTPPPSGATLVDTQTATFTTLEPNITDVEASDIDQTGATVTVTVDVPNSAPVQLHYRKVAESAWSGPMSATVDAAAKTATFALSRLASGTEYTVYASYGSTPPPSGATLVDTQTATFTTGPPSVKKVEVTDKTDTTAKLTVTIAEPNGETQTVSVRYQTLPSGNWITIQPDPTTDTGTAVVDLTSLTANTQYKAEATLSGDFNQGAKSTTFTTNGTGPGVSELVMSGETQTGATATITIANVTAETDVYLRYQTTGSGSWSDPPLEGRSTTAVPGTASIEIAGLTSGTQHKVQASLDGTFVTGVQTATFTTRAPAVSSVIVSGETRSAATVTVGVSAPNGQPVFLQYRTGTGTWIERSKNVDTGEVSVEFGLNGLASGTTYAVQASYDSGFPATDATKTATFATDRSTSTIRPGGGSPSRPSVPSLPPGSDPVSDPNNSPSFSEGSRTLRSVAENTPSGEKVGAPVPAGDDDNDPLSFSLVQSRDSWRFDVTAVNFDILTRYANVVAEASGQVARDFDVVDDLIANSVQILTQSRLDYETKNVYHVTISVLDGMDGNGAEDVRVDDQILVTILVTDLEEQGTVTLSAPTPRVDVELAAFLTDPDEGITDLSWVWERSENRSGWTTISGATSRSYTPTPDDEGFYLRVTASYTDRRGPSKTASAEPENPVAVGFDEEFTDVDDTNTHADAIAALASQGVFVDTECDDQLFCPHLPLTRWAMAVWILRVLVDYPPTVIGSSRFADIPDGTWWIRYVEHLHDRKITIGCTLDPLRYCPDKPVTRAQMTSFLVRALDLPAAQPAGFADTDSTVHAANIDALHAAGITIGCDTEPLRYCPTETVTREQMATFLYRMAPWLDRHALVALYNATNGPNWKNQTNWATDNPINEWYGVQTDTGGGVTSLLLAGNGLHGPIPHALTNLNRLQNLELSANVLTGCLPTALQNIPTNDLTKLGLPHCN